MSAGQRVLLVGDLGDSGFAALRTRHFHVAIGNEAQVVDHRDDVVGAARAFRPTALVSAGNHGPTRALLRVLREVDGDLPAWIDVAGDPFAEAQAAAGAAPANVAAEAQVVWAAAYARGDAFSTVADAGRDSLLGALGVLGRLPRWAPGEEPVWVVPCSADFPDPPGAARGPGLRVALVGGFNTWFDDETAWEGLRRAMERAPLTVDVFGGAIPGHAEAGYHRFRRAAEASPHAARVRFHGWVPHDTLGPALDAAHSTFTVDRPGPEARLGARTRVLYALHRGLRVLATPGSPVVQEAIAAGLVTALAPAGAAEGAETLADALLDGRGAPPAAARAAWLAARSVAATTAPLAHWAARPKRSPPAPHADVLVAVLAERDTLRQELAALRASPTFRALDRLNRRLRSLRS